MPQLVFRRLLRQATEEDFQGSQLDLFEVKEIQIKQISLGKIFRKLTCRAERVPLAHGLLASKGHKAKHVVTHPGRMLHVVCELVQ